MKSLFFALIALTVSFSSMAQTDTKQLCRVSKIQGKEVYVMCEPLRDYEVVAKVNSTVSQLLGNSPTIQNMVNTMVEKAVNKETKGKVGAFDAIITSDGDVALLVKFKEGNTEQKGLARVNKIQGKETYIMCEPLRDYDTVDKVNSTLDQVLGVDPTIQNMVNSMVEKAVNKEQKGKVGNFDAIITSDGDVSILVKFKGA